MDKPGPTPHWRIEKDPLTDELVATSPSGRFKLRGRSYEELTVRRWELWSQVLADYRAAITEVFPGQDGWRQ